MLQSSKTDMQIDPSSTFAGHPIIRIRELVNRCRGYGFYTKRVAKLLDTSTDNAQAVVDALWKAGYVAKERGDGDDVIWSVTDKGNAFGMASAAKPLRRKSCDRIVRNFLDRVDETRDLPFAVYVDHVYLFGSYARGASRPSDIDLYVKLDHRVKDDKERLRMFSERRRIALDSGRTFSNIGEESSWPWTEILRFLKNRSRALSITTVDQWVVDDPDSILIYRHPNFRVNPPYPAGKTE
jgi:predicted nucleotidyltransferase/predicted transcriptional regulator